MVKRDETKPRQSSLTHFISEEELNSIPRDTLENASERGTTNHSIIEKTYGKPTDNIIANMFKEGLSLMFKPAELKMKPFIEVQVNGARFTGKPDFVLNRSIIDYKFTNDLRPQTALQLILYGMLEHESHGTSMENFYAFHFPTGQGLFIHKIPVRSMKPLNDFAEYVIENHEAIKAGKIEKYQALSRWETLLQDYDVFELVGTVLPPMTITNDEEAINAAVIYYNIKHAEERANALKRDLKRYMSENDRKDIIDAYGYGIRLENRTNKMYDKDRKAIAKAVYDKALDACQTGTIAVQSMKRVSPRKKKLKLIN